MTFLLFFGFQLCLLLAEVLRAECPWIQKGIVDPWPLKIIAVVHSLNYATACCGCPGLHALSVLQVPGNKAAIGQTYNICSDRQVTFDGMTRLTAAALGKTPQIHHYNPKDVGLGKGEGFPFRTVHFFASSDKAKRELGWQPQHSPAADIDPERWVCQFHSMVSVFPDDLQRIGATWKSSKDQLPPISSNHPESPYSVFWLTTEESM